MALSSEQKVLCAGWVSAPNRKWQTLNRSQYKYQFREKTLTRYVEEASMDESIVPLLLEYLASDDCKETLQLYGQDVSSDWTPVSARYEISNKSVGNVRAVRLYHTLAIEPASGEDGPYLVEDGCAYKVSWTYYWKRESVPDAPRSQSGISYRITNVQRDPDTGLFNYAIEKRERVQQDIALYLTQTTLYEDRSEEVHLGVRGDESLGGLQASVANGTKTTRKVNKNSDCTHDVHNTVTRDKAVPEASVTLAETATGTRKTTEHRNMSSPASTTGLGPGESVRNEKTATGLYNQTIVSRIRDALVWIGERCRKSVFAHVHTTTNNSKERPPFDHVLDAGDGVVREKSVRRTDDGYAIDESVTTERPVVAAVVEAHRTLRGTTVSTTSRNQPNALDANGIDYGERRLSRVTDGGLHDNTVTTTTPEAVESVSASDRKTIFEERSSTHRSVVSTSLPSATVSSAGDGTVHQKETRRNEDGKTADVTETTIQEYPVGSAEVVKHRTLHGIRTRTTDRNQPSPSGGVPEIGGTISSRRTAGGRFDNTVESFTAQPAGTMAGAASETRLEKETSTTTNSAEYQAPSVVFTNGTVTRKSAARREDNTCDITETTTVGKEWSETKSWRDSNGEYERFDFRNFSSLPMPPSVARNQEYVSINYHYSINQLGLYDGGWIKSDTSLSRTRRSLSVKTNLKFTKRSNEVTAYETRYKKPKRKRQYRKVGYYVEYHYNDAVTDFYNDLIRQNPGRDNAGVVAVKKGGGFGSDLDGNPTAIWLTVERGGANEWQNFDGNSKSWSHILENSPERVIDKLMDSW